MFEFAASLLGINARALDRKAKWLFRVGVLLFALQTGAVLAWFGFSANQLAWPPGARPATR
jgi:hypothetical protein